MKAKKRIKPKRKQAAKLEREQLMAESRAKMQAPDPLSPENRKKLAIRLGIPVLLAWVVAFVIPGWIPKVVVGTLTLAFAGVAYYVLRYAKRTQAVAEILRTADTAEARKDALEKLGSDFKEGDATATFAKAQLQLQDDPRAALATLETIKLDKVMAPMADETRSQRAMIHLMLGELDEARTLVDLIDLGRHKEPKTRATLAAIMGEAWARTGQAKKAAELLETFDDRDEIYADLLPQLYRSLAFAYAWGNQSKKMKMMLRKMNAVNVQLLMGFITRKKNPMGVSPRGVHPALEREAYNMVMRSGAVKRKMEVKRV